MNQEENIDVPNVMAQTHGKSARHINQVFGTAQTAEKILGRIRLNIK